ncbi:DUF6286 domain-containing protein [Streptomyces sp. NPDC093225]|uniref:DUF6286 domain-containing protein n=1 Tax=Streptomyces sp. NPDC093225 TaxID=3366034 RepID=UPI00381D2348
MTSRPPDLHKEPEPAPAAPARHGTARRFWSARRVPAALTAFVLLGAAVVFLYDVAAVRAHRPGMQWRRSLADALARHTLDEPAVTAAAAAAVALGILLLVLAVTPGLRGLLPMRTVVPGVRAGLTRKAAALVLRDRAMEVSGIQSARAAVGRTRLTVRATSHFRPLEEVRADLDHVLAVGLDELGLAREMQVHVKVTRPTKEGGRVR